MNAYKLICGLLYWYIALPAWSSYAIYIGKNFTADGSVMIGGSGDEVSSHWPEVVPAATHAKDATVTVGVTDEAFMPGEFIAIPLTAETFRYLTVNYSEYEGFPQPLANGGLNDHNVAGRDVWSPSRPEMVAMTPNPQTGPHYSDLSRIAMERARAAREAVEIIGELIDEHGYSTYGGNLHMFADENEGWVLLNFAGGQGLWIAERRGPDDIRMSYPGYILEIPLNYAERPDFMGAPHFIEFAIEQGWFDPERDEAFNVTLTYGVDKERYPRSAMEDELRAAAPIDLRWMMQAVRDPRISKDSTGYGQVAALMPNSRSEMNSLWIAPTGSVTSPFISCGIGVQRIPPQYGKHRHLTKGEDARFITEDWKIQEATEFAGRTFKRLMYFTCDHPEKFLPEVTEALVAFEDALIREQETVVETAETLFEAGKSNLALSFLTEYSAARGEAALKLGNALLGSIEARTKLLCGHREPTGDVVSRLTDDRVDCLPAQ